MHPLVLFCTNVLFLIYQFTCFDLKKKKTLAQGMDDKICKKKRKAAVMQYDHNMLMTLSCLAEVHVLCSIDPGHGWDMARPYTQKLLDTTACQRLKVMVRVVCRDPDTGQEVSVRVRTPSNPESTVTQIHIQAFFLLFYCFLCVFFLVDDCQTD